MFKYMKYEIRGTYKYILGVLALVLILTTALYVYFNRIINTSGEVSALGGMFTGLSVLILFGTALATFLYIVGSFRKELYEDTGYLTFTLPLTGNQIVGSKLVVAFLWFTILGVAIGLYNIIMVLAFAPVEVNISELFSSLFQMFSLSDTLFLVLSSILSLVNMLVIIYFSMAISRVTFRNKRIGSLWFIVFLVLSGLIIYGGVKISELLPYYIDLNTFNIGTMDTLNQLYIELNNNIVLSGNTGILTTNIASTVYIIIVTVLLFLGTGYLIERKIDL